MTMKGSDNAGTFPKITCSSVLIHANWSLLKAGRQKNMTEKVGFNFADCIETSLTMSTANMVVVRNKSRLPQKCQDALHQVYYYRKSSRAVVNSNGAFS